MKVPTKKKIKINNGKEKKIITYHKQHHCVLCASIVNVLRKEEEACDILEYGFLQEKIKDANFRCKFNKENLINHTATNMPADQIQYSEKYFDAVYEYRHVILPPDLTKLVPKSHLMTETEWRNLGVQQSPGWVHYMMHAPEPHVILFRRPRTDLPDVSNSVAVVPTANSNTNAEQLPASTQPSANNNVSVHG